MTRRWWQFFGLFLVSFLAIVGGLLLLVVGVLVTLPLATGAIVYAYEDIFGGPNSAA